MACCGGCGGGGGAPSDSGGGGSTTPVTRSASATDKFAPLLSREEEIPATLGTAQRFIFARVEDFKRG